MTWNEKDSLDLVLMIVGAVIGGVLALGILHFVFMPSNWAMAAVPACAVIGGYTLRWTVWNRGLRKHF